LAGAKPFPACKKTEKGSPSLKARLSRSREARSQRFKIKKPSDKLGTYLRYFAAAAGFLYVPQAVQARCGNLGSPQFGQTLIDGVLSFQFVRLFALRVVETLLFGTAMFYTS